MNILSTFIGFLLLVLSMGSLAFYRLIDSDVAFGCLLLSIFLLWLGLGYRKTVFFFSDAGQNYITIIKTPLLWDQKESSLVPISPYLIYPVEKTEVVGLLRVSFVFSKGVPDHDDPSMKVDGYIICGKRHTVAMA